MHRFTRFTHKLLSAILLVGLSISGQAQENLLENPGFESDFTGWDQYFGRIGEWSSEDADGSASSGSALIGNEGTSDGVVPLVLNQCLSVQAGQEYQFGGDVRVPAGQPSGTSAYIFVNPFTNSDCVGDLNAFETTGSSSGNWVSVDSAITTGAGVQSMLFAIGVFKPNGETADAEALFDNLFLLGADGDVFQVNPSMAASWYNPDESGHGIMIHLLDADTAWMCWFTFDDMGNPAWICAVGTIDGDTITFDEAFTVEGGVFPPDFDPGLIEEVPWGSITVVFTGCNAGTVMWTTNTAGFSSGEMPIARLTPTWGAACND